MKRFGLLLILVLVACGDDATGPAVEPPPACEPRAFPEAAFAEARDVVSERVERARALAARTLAVHPPHQMAWDWGPGVLMLSLVDLYRATGDTALRDYFKAWIDHHRAHDAYKTLLTSSDRCPPALSALALYQESCELGYRQVVADTLHLLFEEALRTEDGGINHLGTQDILGISLWLDSLFMFGNVLTRWGHDQDDARSLDEFHRQFVVFQSHLQDDSGWMVHAHGWPGDQDPGVFWARGNAWVTAATYEYLNVRKERGEQDPEVESAIRAQVEAIVAAQDGATGLWWTVVNRPGETYLETSASALFALGLARGYRGGFLDASVLPAIEAAMTGIAASIRDDPDGPVVTGISGPTTVGDFDHYASIEVGDDIDYGVGAVILALLETSGLE